jgi:nicotinamide-nucleotide amidase
MSDSASRLLLTIPEEMSHRLELALKPITSDRRTIVLAESCTAGLVASAISGVEGLGHVLECGFVVYTDAAKTRLLGVPPAILKREGAVSEDVARLMAEGALARAESDIAIAITGFAGPAGPSDEEGLVHFALARSDQTTVHRVEHFGARGTDVVRLAALGVVIELLETAGAQP